MWNQDCLFSLNTILDSVWIYHSTQFTAVSKKLFLIYQSAMAVLELYNTHLSWMSTEGVTSFQWVRVILRSGSLIASGQNNCSVTHLIPWAGLCLSSGYSLFHKYVYGGTGLLTASNCGISCLLFLNAALQTHLFWKKRSQPNQENVKTTKDLLLEEEYDKVHHIPEEYFAGAFVPMIPICPITLDPIRFAVIDPTCGKVFEGRALKKWVQNNGTSPITRQPLTLSQIHRCHQKQFWIDFFLRSVTSYLKSKEPAH